MSIKALGSTEAVECPFCKEPDFDLAGLKTHITLGWCEVWNSTKQAGK